MSGNDSYIVSDVVTIKLVCDFWFISKYLATFPPPTPIPKCPLVSGCGGIGITEKGI